MITYDINIYKFMIIPLELSVCIISIVQILDAFDETLPNSFDLIKKLNFHLIFKLKKKTRAFLRLRPL
jgi:hypothetical protein